MMIFDLLHAALLYVAVPVWLVAGVANYRASRIECTGGPKESLLHVAQLAEAGLPLLAALLLEINAGVILLMILCLFLHSGSGGSSLMPRNCCAACAGSVSQAARGIRGPLESWPVDLGWKFELRYKRNAYR